MPRTEQATTSENGHNEEAMAWLAAPPLRTSPTPDALAAHMARLREKGSKRTPDMLSASGTITTLDGTSHPVEIDFGRFSTGNRYTDADLTVEIDGAPIYEVRMAIDSPGEQERLARTLERICALRDPGWPQLVNVACGKARAAHLDKSYAIDINTVDITDVDEQLVAGLFVEDEINMVFALPETAKSLVTLSVMHSVICGAPWLDRVTRPASVLWLDYESQPKRNAAGVLEPKKLARRHKRLAAGAGIEPPDFRWMPGSRTTRRADYDHPTRTRARRLHGLGCGLGRVRTRRQRDRSARRYAANQCA